MDCHLMFFSHIKHGRNVLLISMSRQEKQRDGNCAAVRDDVVYEWAEDYFHLDDKAIEEKKKKRGGETEKNSRSGMLRSVSNRSPNRSPPKKRHRKRHLMRNR